MRLSVDAQVDAVYLKLDDRSIVESEEVHPGIALDFDAEGKFVGVEILHASGTVPADSLKTLTFQAA